MVYSTITDGLGNILFQIAAGASLAHKNGSDFLVYLSDIEIPGGKTLKEHVEPFCTNILRDVKFIDRLPEDSIEYIQPGFEFFEIGYFDKIRLTGYYQSEKFFDKKYIKDLFSIDEKTFSYINNKYGHLFKEEIISLHVRRGDYINRPLRQPICEMPYFKRAINYLGKDKRYFIFSDDIDWCKKKFRGENFIFSSNESPVVDLYLQSFCTHNIISNSSFSWWGAWLNSNPSKIVIAPVKWFGLQMTNYNLKDLIPTDWIRIQNPRTIYMKIRISYSYFLDLFVRANWKLIRIKNHFKKSRFFNK